MSQIVRALLECVNELCNQAHMVQSVSLPTLAPGFTAVPTRVVCNGCGQDVQVTAVVQ